MKIYKIAHENIICPSMYRKVEIEKEDLEQYIQRSVAFENMLENLPDMGDIGAVEEEEYVEYLIANWTENQVEEFYKIGYYDIGDFDLIIEN